MKQVRLAPKKYWNSVHRNDKPVFVRKLEGLQYYDFFEKLRPYIRKGDKVLEIGCAPGTHLIKLSRKFGIEAHGVEYSPVGVQKTIRTLEFNKVSGTILEADFFSKKYQKEHIGMYDMVFSIGFIEHFSDPKKVVEHHFNLVKKKGYVVMTVPNLKHLNKLLFSKDIIEKHNLNIMSTEGLRELIPKKHKVLHTSYNGGLYNLGLFFFKNNILETLRYLLFIGQRLVVDPILILLRKVGIDLSNKYTSPQIMIIAQKI